MNKPKPANRKSGATIDSLISFIEQTMKSFVGSSSFKTQYHQNSDEDHLTELLLWHYWQENRQHGEKYIFMSQPKQENKRKVDIGIGLHGGSGNYIFCIEAKILPTREYVSGNTGAIKRFKKCDHGLSSSNPKIGKPLPQNGIAAYVKSGTFEKHFVNINKQIQNIANQYSQQADEFGLTWHEFEKLEKIYFNSIGKLFSKHPRQKTSDVSLHHFWIYVT